MINYDTPSNVGSRVIARPDVFWWPKHVERAPSGAIFQQERPPQASRRAAMETQERLTCVEWFGSIGGLGHHLLGVWYYEREALLTQSDPKNVHDRMPWYSHNRRILCLEDTWCLTNGYSLPYFIGFSEPIIWQWDGKERVKVKLHTGKGVDITYCPRKRYCDANCMFIRLS